MGEGGLVCRTETCHILSLDCPEIKIETTRNNRGWEHSAAAYFHNDPFLARVGAIGRVERVIGQDSTAREACAKEVVRYLIDMVMEDIALEKEIIVAERDEAQQSCGRLNCDRRDFDMRDAD